MKFLKKTGNEYLVVTLGAKGFIAYKNPEMHSGQLSQHFPAINPMPVDVAGAGDALLSCMAGCITSGASVFQASALATIVASLTISRVGNVAVKQSEILDQIHLLENLHK